MQEQHWKQVTSAHVLCLWGLTPSVLNAAGQWQVVGVWKRVGVVVYLLMS